MVDASIVAKWYLIEEYSDKAVELRDFFATGRVGLLTPALLFYEVLNALRYSGVYTRDELREVARSLTRYGFETRDPRGKTAEDMSETSVAHGISVYDAAYVSLTSDDCILYTTDSEILEKFPENTRHIKDFKAA